MRPTRRNRLHVLITANGGAIVQWADPNGADRQRRLAGSPGGYVRLIGRNRDKAVKVRGASTADGADIVQYDDRGGNDQQWKFSRIG
ncbi:RICIN domain-containing protein [Streptosporangium subroseum]|uniref:RICIN domain-containing protein n=1 Tax=Streptosporangium subroseum TaxID=106412 RepID=UPI00308A4AFF|nr:RICIN domain-containing protein [Streptosporangium subroseum]